MEKQHPQTTKTLDLPVFLFLWTTPIVAVIASVVYFLYFPFTWDLLFLFIFFSFASSVSITAGYHRMLSHRAYKSKGWLKNIFLFFGAGTFQSPALLWVADHRMHHRYVDTKRDPYNIKQGFMHAHMSWLFYKFERNMSMVQDLLADRWLVLQQRYFIPLAVFSGFITPMFVAMLIGSQAWWVNMLAGLIFGGALRISYVLHCTFFINSICHMWGKRPYNDENTARDNFFFALLTNGEGYHNFHHQFQFDYRNGVRWYHWDPTKWLIRLLAIFRQTYDLRTTSQAQILVAKLALKQRRLADRVDPFITEKLESIRAKVEKAQKRLRLLNKEYFSLKENIRRQSRHKLIHLRADLKIAKIEFEQSCKQWNLYLQYLQTARFA